MKYCIVTNEPCISNLHFGELHSDNFINDKNNLFEIYFRKCYKVNIILISFNCFSEYIFFGALVEREATEKKQPKTVFNQGLHCLLR